MITSNLFIRGPIPCTWIRNATLLGKTAGLVGTLIWFYVGLNKGSKTFKLDGKFDLLANISRQSRQRALRKLSEAGLVSIYQSSGAYPTITIHTHKQEDHDAHITVET